MNVLELAAKKVNLKKVASTHGGEWQGPCPDCGGKDRFHVWPNQNTGGSYWCRGCGKAGDNIQFLRDFSGLSFHEACEYLDISMPDRPSSMLSERFKTPAQPSAPKPSAFVPAEHQSPDDRWLERAEKFVSWAQEKLRWNTDAIGWLEERGIALETAKEFRLGWNPGEDGKDIYRSRKSWGLPEVFREDGRPKALWIPVGLVIPYFVDGVLQRVRIRRPEGEQRYYVLPGSSMPVMVIAPERRAFVVVEAELDAIACATACPQAGAIALGSVSAKPTAEADAVLRDALSILLALDFDVAGKKFVSWWTEHYPNCRRWPVPQGKDPGDARRMGTDLDLWIKAGLPPILTIESGKGRPEPVEVKPPDGDTATSGTKVDNLPEPVRELWELLKKNPAVRIINTLERFTILRHGKYVGGRINELVMRIPVVTDYVMGNPAREIDWSNLIYAQDSPEKTLPGENK